MDCKEIRRRFEELATDRKIAEGTWEKLERYIMPIGGGKFFSPEVTEGEAEWERRDVFDDTAIEGCDTLAASVHGSLTSPAVRWFDFQFRTPELNKNVEAKQWLDDAGTQVWYGIQESNFNLEASEGYLDLCSMGNMGMFHEPKSDLRWEGMHFDAVPLKECYFEEDENGHVLRFYRLMKLRPAAIVDKFGTDKVPEVIAEKAQNAVTERQEIIFCIYPRDGIEPSDYATPQPVENRPYGFKYILRENAEQCGDEGGYHEMPAYMVRWRRASGSQWGYGPGHLALPTVLTLNELVSMVLESAEKVIDPPSLVSQRGLLSDLDLQAGGQTVVRDVDKDVKAYESGARFDVSALQVNDLRSQVRRLFHVDQLQLKESPAMSATEVMVRYELMNRLLGPTMGRLQNDLLDPLVSTTFRMMYRAGVIPKMPEVVAQAGGIVDIEYVGPLSRAQKSDEVAAVERWLGNLATLAEVFPPIRNVPNPVEVAKKMANQLNIDSNLLNTDQIITQLNAKDAMIQELSQQLQVMQQAADVDNAQTQASGGLRGV